MHVTRPAPDLESLEMLLAVGEMGSISSVARAHSLSQPAVTARMNLLESRLGLRLLERGPSGTRLTADGWAVAEHARRVVDAAVALSAATEALRDRSTGRLRVAASLTIADHLMPAWVLSLRHAAPQVSITLRVTNSAAVIAAVLGRSADIGFVEGTSGPLSALRARRVGGDQLVLVVSRDHPWARRCSLVSPAELAATPLVLREAGSGTRQVLEDQLARHGLQTMTQLELGSTAAIFAAARRGEAPAVVSSLAVAEELATQHLVTVQVGELDLRRTFRAVWSVGRRLSPVERRLLAIAEGSARQA
ncbi:MAG TPA: LysR family transcriptional regulator [Candidatus Acidoferrales bacterium]|nr:LysR family transcriptional regulator [Candidatus Acidoferrales bacterium]